MATAELSPHSLSEFMRISHYRVARDMKPYYGEIDDIIQDSVLGLLLGISSGRIAADSLCMPGYQQGILKNVQRRRRPSE